MVATDINRLSTKARLSASFFARLTVLDTKLCNQQMPCNPFLKFVWWSECHCNKDRLKHR